MTTFVASLWVSPDIVVYRVLTQCFSHLPYTVHFDSDADTLQYRSPYASPIETRDRSLSATKKSPPRMKLPPSTAIRVDTKRTPFEAPLPVPNLLQTLGRSLSNEPTPPLTPSAAGSPSGEELFFQLNDVENAPLGSPSDPYFPRRPNQPKARSKSPSSAEQTTTVRGPEDGYFALPPMTYKRPKRRSSASERSSSFADKSWRIEKTDQGNGGLKNAVEAALAEGSLQEKTWVGVLGFPTDGLDESVKIAIEGRLRDDYDSLVAFPNDKDFDGHYNHYCKEVRDTLPS
jgi:hypothetical protein